MAELVATMVVGPLVAMVKEKASSYLLDQYKVMEGMEDLHKILKRKLPAILDVITDAEQAAASQREGAKSWLEELKTVAYQANEVFDEFKYEALRRQAKKNGHYSELGFHVVKLFPTHNRFVFRYKMANKLRSIVQAIEVLVAEMNAFGFKYQAPASMQWRQTDSIIVDPENIAIRSRDGEKQQLVSRLIDPANTANLMVLPIIGMGGLGKTTLAQFIYNDPDVQKHFQLQRWVCVSNDFDAYDLARKISLNHGEEDNAQALLNLRDELRGKRYLVVLDDVWNRDPDKWEKLKACLQHGGAGSVVLVTARDKEIAQLMHTVEAHSITDLDKEFIKEIIEKRAFSPQQSKPDPELLAMVDEFADICAGSPLAAKALGSVLRTKTSPEEWKAVLKKSNICNKGTEIFPVLKLSYDDLSSDMKQCFAFCAVFPKDYEIDVEKLIQLWIAHGFIQEQKEVRPETIAKQIFNELASRSFFQDVKQVRVEEIERIGGYYRRNICKMHDLMHDVALSITEKECALATDQSSQIECDITTEEPSQIEWLTDTTRHLFLSCREPGNILDNSLAKRSPAIQTLLCDRDMGKSLQHLSKYSSLQALRTRIGLGRSFPLKPKHLHHLRYLDLSGSHIEALPEDISILYNLQTLDLSGCRCLCELPRQMKYMTALHRLYTHGCPDLKSMPPGLRKLTSLQTLTCFVAGTGPDCSNVGELQNLNLGGQLELYQLENVTEEDAKKANLGKKKELRELTLKWTNGCEDDSRVLEGLKPHDGLQVIRIDCYGGTTFPTWMAMLRNMVEIHISRCGNLQCLFKSNTSFTFPKLKALEGLHCLERWWEINNGVQGEEIMFPQLEKLSIIDCGKLTALPEAALISESYVTVVWSAFPALKVLNLENLENMESFRRLEAVEGTQGEHIMFPKLEVLSIKNCPVLVALSEPAFPALKVLNLENLKNMESFRRLKAVEGTQREHIMFPQLEELSVENCPVLIALSGGPFPTLKILELKYLMGLQRLEAVEGTQGEHIMFPQLKELSIKNCPVLIALSESPFPALKVLNLENLEKMESFRRLEAVEGTQGEHIMFPQLKELSIKNCPVLIALSESPFPALKVLNLEKLEKMESFRRLEAVEGTQGEHIMFPQLEELSVEKCPVLIALSGGPFPTLKILELKYLMGLQRLEAVEGTQRQEVMFPQLEKLLIVNCEMLRTLPGQPIFPNLENVRIEGCPMLKTPVEVEAPKLNVLEMTGSEEQMLPWVARHMASLTNLKLILKTEDTETTWAAAEHSLSEVVDGKEKWNHDFPLAVMKLHGFTSGVTELCACFVQLQDLKICGCHALIHWPEREFQSLVSLKKLYIRWCENLTGYAEAPPEPSTSSEMSPLLPSLESLRIWNCESLVEVFNVPASLRRMKIDDCGKLESIYGRRLQEGKSASEVSSSAAGARPEHFLLPCLESLHIENCDSLTGALDLPPFLKELEIESCGGLTGALDLPPYIKELRIAHCNGLRSLESYLGELPSLERLSLWGCETLSSLPDGPQAYPSLRSLWIGACPGIERNLPTCLQQRQDSERNANRNDQRNDQRNESVQEGPKPRLWKPKTWKYVIRRD